MRLRYSVGYWSGFLVWAPLWLHARRVRLPAPAFAGANPNQSGVYCSGGRQSREPTLALFTGTVSSSCGSASAAVGPSYCPGDQKLYVDLSFFHDLSARYGALGDFTQVYVIAHEAGHPVQTLLEMSDKVRGAGKGASETQGNALSMWQDAPPYGSGNTALCAHVSCFQSG